MADKTGLSGRKPHALINDQFLGILLCNIWDNTRYAHVHHEPHAEHMVSSIGQIAKLEVQLRQHHAVLHLSCSQVSE